MEYRYRKLIVNTIRLQHIQALITAHPDWSRRKLSKQVCEDFNWRQQNGHLRDMVCRSLLLELHRAGYIDLPPVKFQPNNPLANRKQPQPVDIDQTPINNLDKLEFIQVRNTPDERLYDRLIASYHYLGYSYPVGEYLKYIAFVNERPVGCIGLACAVRHIKCRDHFIGWTKQQREANLHLLAYNTRFLVLPWVKIYCLASRLLSQTAKVVSRDWETYFQHPIYYLETFVDTERFVGTCYQAANWIFLGTTTGRGKNDHTNKANRSIKAVWGYPLAKDFRERLQHG